MAYQGLEVPFPLGELGLRTDESISRIPPNALLQADNVEIYNGKIRKSNGTSKITDGVTYNQMAGPVFSLLDYQATGTQNRTLAIVNDEGTDMKLYKDYSQIGSGLTEANPEQCMIVQGGNEDAASGAHAFFFTGENQVQVLDADGGSVGAINNPATDWGSNYPTHGGIYDNRLFAFGNPNYPHQIYFSAASDHEDFTTTSGGAEDRYFVYNIYPGEGEGLVGATVFRGRLILFKAPYGVYILEGNIGENPRISRYSNSFGLSSPHGIAQGLQDLIVANSYGSLTSMRAAEEYGEFKAGDILAQTKTEDYFRTELRASGYQYSHGLYYPEKKTFYFTQRSTSGSEQDRAIMVDANEQTARIVVDTKDQMSCMALVRDSDGIPRPYYGDENGDVFRLDDDSTSNVGKTSSDDGTAFTGIFQTAFTDMSYVDPSYGPKNKHFDFVSITYRPNRTESFLLKVFIDLELRCTIRVAPGASSSTLPVTLPFTLAGDALISERIPLSSCFGKRISLQISNQNLSEGFEVEELYVSFRVANEDYVP